MRYFLICVVCVILANAIPALIEPTEKHIPNDFSTDGSFNDIPIAHSKRDITADQCHGLKKHHTHHFPHPPPKHHHNRTQDSTGDSDQTNHSNKTSHPH